jgi:hypothetical protein
MCKTDELIKFMFRDYDRKKGENRTTGGGQLP